MACEMGESKSTQDVLVAVVSVGLLLFLFDVGIHVFFNVIHQRPGDQSPI